MPNDFYNYTVTVSSGTKIRADKYNSDKQAIEAGFDAVEELTAKKIEMPDGFSGDIKIPDKTLTNTILYINNDGNLDVYDLDTLVTAISGATASEISQVANIDDVEISYTQWGFLGSLDQAVSSDSDVTFASQTITGNQNVKAEIQQVRTTGSDAVRRYTLGDGSSAAVDDLSIDFNFFTGVASTYTWCNSNYQFASARGAGALPTTEAEALAETDFHIDSLGNATAIANLNAGTSNNSIIRLNVKGSGATSGTYAAYFENSAATNLFFVRDDGAAYLSGISGFGTTPVAGQAVTIRGIGTTTGKTLKLDNSSAVETHYFNDQGDAYHLGQLDVGKYINFPNSTGTGAAGERYIGTDGANRMYYNVPNGLAHKFGVNNSDIMDILSTGIDAHVPITVTGAVTIAGGNRLSISSGGTASGTSIYSPAANEMGLSTNSAEFLRANSTQNIGIGTNPIGASRCSIFQDTGGDNILRVGTSTEGGFLRAGTANQTYNNGWNASDTAIFVGGDSTTSRSIAAWGSINASGADYAEYVRLAIWILLHNEAIKNDENLTDEEKGEQYIKIKAGDVIGFDSDGRVTTKFSESKSFGVKSTKPNLVGGDTWAMTPKPEIVQPDEIEYTGIDNPVEPTAPAVGEQPVEALEPTEVFDPIAADCETAEEYAAELYIYNDYLAAKAVYEQYLLDVAAYETYLADKAQYDIDKVAYDEALAQYESDQAIHAQLIASEQARVDAINEHALTEWNEQHEAERATVDRIAFCGVVPVNGVGTCSAGDYLIAVDNGDDSIGILVKPQLESFADQANSIGRVKSIAEDGRPEIIVKVG